jgi:hypothetical protein
MLFSPVGESTITVGQNQLPPHKMGSNLQVSMNWNLLTTVSHANACLSAEGSDNSVPGLLNLFILLAYLQNLLCILHVFECFSPL